MPITHALVPTHPNNPADEISKDAWVAAHLGSNLTVTDGTTSVANVTQETVVGAVVSAGGAGEAIVTVAVPGLPAVLAVDRATGGASINGTAGILILDGAAGILGYSGVGAAPGSSIDLTAGDGETSAGVGASVQINAGSDAPANGFIDIRTDGSHGDPGDVLTSLGNVGGTFQQHWEPLPSTIPTADEKAALDAAPTALTAANPVASVADLPVAPSPGSTVTGPDAFGASATAGMSADYSRADHDHGLPAAPAIPFVWEDLF